MNKMTKFSNLTMITLVCLLLVGSSLSPNENNSFGTVDRTQNSIQDEQLISNEKGIIYAQTAGDNLFIQNEEIVSIADETFANIYIFDKAQVTLTNVTVTGDIDISGNATLLMRQGGGMNRLIVSGNATVTLNNINYIEERLSINDWSTTILVNHTYLNGFADVYGYGEAHLQVSDSLCYFDDAYFHDSCQVTLENCTRFSWGSRFYEESMLIAANCVQISEYYLYLRGNSYAVIESVSNQRYFYVYDESEIYIQNSQIEELILDGFDYNYQSPLVWSAVNVTVTDSLIIRDQTQATFTDCDLKVAAQCYRAIWSDDVQTNITLINTNATLTKESSGSSDYNSTIYSLTVQHSDITVMFLNIQHLNASDHSFISDKNVQWGTIELDNTSFLVGDDYDMDGLSDSTETQIYATDPYNPDTDGDGYGDGEEIQFGTDPLDSMDIPEDITCATLTADGISDGGVYNGIINMHITAIDDRGMKNIQLHFNDTTIYNEDISSDKFWKNGTFDFDFQLDTRMYADGSYLFVVQGIDIHSNAWEIFFNIEIDNTPIITTLIGPADLSNNSRTASGRMLEFAFSETPQTVFYAWDGAPSSTILSPIPAGNGWHILEIWTTDAAGNANYTTFSFEVDDSQIFVYLENCEDGDVIPSSFELNITFSRPPTEVYYAWDSEPESNTLPPIPTEQGLHTLQIRTVSDTRIERITTFTFTIDDIPPSITLVSPEEFIGLNSGIEIQLSISEAYSQLIFSWDGGKNFTQNPILPVGNGYHILHVWVADFVPYWTYANFTFLTDDPLMIDFITWTNGTVVESNVTINMTIKGTLGNYFYAWDEAPYIEAPLGQWPTTPILDGQHSLNIWISDEDSETLSATLILIVANPLIDITLLYPQNNTIIAGYQEISLSFSEDPVIAYYSWDGQPNSTILTAVPNFDGIHTLDVWVLNEHGSWNHKHFEWLVDVNDPPEVVILYPTGGEILQGQVTFSWDGSDPDNDPLTYAIFISTDGVSWLKIVEGLTREVYTFNTNDYPEGVYYLEIHADDGEIFSIATLQGTIEFRHTVEENNTNDEENPFETFTIPGFPIIWLIIPCVLVVSKIAPSYRRQKLLK